MLIDYWTFFFVLNIFCSIKFYPRGEIVTMSKIPKFSNETPGCQNIRPLLRCEATFYAKWSNFFTTGVLLLTLGKSVANPFCLIVQEYMHTCKKVTKCIIKFWNSYSYKETIFKIYNNDILVYVGIFHWNQM